MDKIIDNNYSKLKETLLSYNLVVDDEWLDKYVELIKLNISTQKSSLCDRHHVIPICYYKKIHSNDQEYDTRTKADKALACATLDENNFTVFLFVNDHATAHTYLSKCGKEQWFINQNQRSAEFILKNKINQPRLSDINKLQLELDKITAITTTSNTASQQQSELSKIDHNHYVAKFVTIHIPTTENPYARYKSKKIECGLLIHYLRAGCELKTTNKLHWIYKNNEFIKVKANQVLDYLENGWNYAHIDSDIDIELEFENIKF